LPVSVTSLVPYEPRADASASDAAAMVTANGLTFRFGATTYRVLPPGATPAADEELVDKKQSQKVLEGAAQLDDPGDADFGGRFGSTAALLTELRRSTRALVVVRLRPRAPSASSPPRAPEPAPPPPPLRKPKPVKEGWIEIEVVDDSGEPRQGDSYRLKLPDGRVLEGTIGSKGIIAVHGIDPGSTELSITSLKAAASST
jgi:hypothetical protein